MHIGLRRRASDARNAAGVLPGLAVSRALPARLLQGGGRANDAAPDALRQPQKAAAALQAAGDRRTHLDQVALALAIG